MIDAELGRKLCYLVDSAQARQILTETAGLKRLFIQPSSTLFIYNVFMECHGLISVIRFVLLFGAGVGAGELTRLLAV